MKSYKGWIIAGLLVTALIPAGIATVAESPEVTAQIQSLLSQIQALQAQIAALQASQTSVYHDADLNEDYKISQTELDNVTTLFNSSVGYKCGSNVIESGWIWSPGTTPRGTSCAMFSGDLNDDWKIQSAELLRVVQFKNIGGYKVQAGTEDGFAPGLATPIAIPVVTETASSYHDADLDRNYRISQGELDNVVSLFNSSTGYKCTTNPIYVANGWIWVVGSNSDSSCRVFSADTSRNYKVELVELNRVIQLKNAGGYKVQAGTVDGFAPGLAVAFSSTLNISTDPTTPETKVVLVDDTSDTDDVTLLKGRLSLSGTADAFLHKLPVTFIATKNNNLSGGLDDIAGSVHLKLNGEEIAIKGVSTTMPLTGTIIFDNLDFEIDAGDTVEFEVLADIGDTSGDLNSGDTLKALVSATNRDAIDIKNENNVQFPNTSKLGTAVGNVQTFAEVSPMVQFISQSTTTETDDYGSNIGNFRIRFRVTAVGDNIWIDKDTVNNITNPSVTTDGLSVVIDRNGVVSSSNQTLMGSSLVYVSGAEEGPYAYLVQEGDSAVFELTTVVTPNIAGQFRASINGIKWDTDGDDNTTKLIFGNELSAFKTGYIALNAVAPISGTVSTTPSAPVSTTASSVVSPTTLVEPNVALVSQSARITPGETISDTGTFKIKFKVTNPNQSDIWIDKEVVNNITTPTVSTDGLATAVSKSGVVAGTNSSNLHTFTATTGVVGDSSHAFVVKAGQSRELNLETLVSPKATGLFQTAITGIKWDSNNDDASARLISGTKVQPLKTQTISLAFRNITVTPPTTTSTTTPTITQTVSNVAVGGLINNTWTGGETKNVSWNSTGLGTSNVDIILCNSTQCWPAVMNTPNDGSQSMNLYMTDKTEGRDYYIKVRKYNNNNITGKSANFIAVKAVTTTTDKTSAIFLSMEKILFDMGEYLLGR